MDYASTDLLPEFVERLVNKMGRKATCLGTEIPDASVDDDVQGALDRLEENPNLLLIGPPGTGKSVLLDKLARHIEKPGIGVLFDPDETYAAWSDSAESAEPGKASTVVFHPSYTYDNLVVGLLPKVKGNAVSVGVTTGPLVNLAQYASNGRRALLVLDEFNRGNAAAILGDTLALLDKDKRDVAQVELPSFGLPLEVPSEFGADGETMIDTRLTLPKTLWIVAAMNSSDRSVAPLDAALRRRFSIVEIMPSYKVLSEQLMANPDADLDADWQHWTTSSVAQLAVTLLKRLNERIEASLGRDFTLGHSNFWSVGGASSTEALASLANAWDMRIVQTLRLALQDDEDTLSFILRAGQQSETVSAAQTRAAYWGQTNPAFEQYARPRLEFNMLSELGTFEQLTELKRLAGA
ncbi:AAA family ATPase [Leucobacter sp. CSA2]|uniref:AAA family ATPase n=1 Tax=Leucobacter edaphi TaxID=2796472 RepID=A0A934QEW8_9MICO|nr:AAA family ATPase [Leucobacter edaphi]MBK0422770.1 AAA family ATPase [Leucobacter edaphi]